MTRRKWHKLGAFAVFAVLCICSSCSPSDDDPGIQPTSTTTALHTAATPTQLATPTPKASSASPDDVARQEVLALVRKYFAVDEAIATDMKLPLDRYYEVAAGDYVQALLQGAQAQRAKKYRVLGKVKVGNPHIDTLAKRNVGGRPTSATVHLCLDVSGVNVVDQKGESVVEPGRSSAYVETLTLHRMKTGWRVVDGKDKDTNKCAD